MENGERLRQISICMDELEKARKLPSERPNKSSFNREIWEMDMLEELHRLLYEEGH